MATKEKNIWILLIFVLCGIVLGGLIGELVSQIDALWWFGYGNSFGLSNPLTLDLGMLSLTFALTVKINIASIVGIAISLLLYHKM